jgi:hypothetical protein
MQKYTIKTTADERADTIVHFPIRGNLGLINFPNFSRSCYEPRLTTKDENEPRVGQDAILSHIYFRRRYISTPGAIRPALATGAIAAVRRDLNAQFHHVTIVKDVVSPHHLPIIYGSTAPDAGRFQSVEEIPVHLSCKLLYGTPLLQYERWISSGPSVQATASCWASLRKR